MSTVDTVCIQYYDPAYRWSIYMHSIEFVYLPVLLLYVQTYNHPNILHTDAFPCSIYPRVVPRDGVLVSTHGSTNATMRNCTTSWMVHSFLQRVVVTPGSTRAGVRAKQGSHVYYVDRTLGYAVCVKSVSDAIHSKNYRN